MTLQDVVGKIDTLQNELDVFMKQVCETWNMNGGCKECGGEGRILSWSTMDSPSYNEYKSCTECTIESRKQIGIRPGISYWAKFWPVEKDVQNYNELKENLLLASNEIALWSDLAVGKEVTSVKKSRAKGSPPKGVVSIIVSMKVGEFGETWYLKDKEGNFYRSPGNALQITDPKPKWKPFELTIPVIIVPRMNMGWTILNMLTFRGEQRVWANDIKIGDEQIKDMDKHGKYLVTEAGDFIPVYIDQAFEAKMPTWKYNKHIQRITT